MCDGIDFFFDGDYTRYQNGRKLFFKSHSFDGNKINDNAIRGRWFFFQSCIPTMMECIVSHAQ